MTREEKIKALEEKILAEIAEAKPRLIKELKKNFDNTSKFCTIAAKIFIYNNLEQTILNYPVFEEECQNEYTVKEDTLDMLLKENKILSKITTDLRFTFDFNDEFWEHQYFTIFERIAFDG